MKPFICLLRFSAFFCFLCGFLSRPLTAGLTCVWSGSSSCSAFGVDPTGNLYVGGCFSATCDFNPSGPSDIHIAVGQRDVALCKYAPGGALLWSRVWGGSGDDTCNGIAVDSSGNVYAAGRYRNTVDFDPLGTSGTQHAWCKASGTDSNDAFLCKYDPSGNFQWVRTWGGSLGDEAYSVAVAGDGSGFVYVVGDFSSPTIDFNPAGPSDIHANTTADGWFDAYLCKFSTSGVFQWAKTWGGIGYDDCCAVTTDASGDIYAAGMFGSPICDFDPGSGVFNLSAHTTSPPYMIVDAFLSKFDSAGNFKWARAWGGSGQDVAEGVAVDGTGGV